MSLAGFLMMNIVTKRHAWSQWAGRALYCLENTFFIKSEEFPLEEDLRARKELSGHTSYSEHP